ncbi:MULTISPECIES: hypothetical protein [unclassified Viridibacillus]|uniref:hypothetical protein n=1 Tax=unclassified Viridibacillus TaxID=2617942 RepID=UPI00096F2D51|nr:hypothetical protein [Viridibacillus sp. FSL H8-0123]OMC81679.1 hypothetical protein BK130_13495 [Viridibacillus sp. FSL H8-0123]
MTEILMDTIQSFNKYLPRVAKGSQDIAENLRSDQIAIALKMILDFSEGMSWLLEASELFKVNNVKVDVQIEKVQEFLQEINAGLEMQDYVLVADMFEYEISPFFEAAASIEVLKN